MWYSFHIYFIKPQEFFRILSDKRYSEIKKFFIYYIDFEGVHIRLRLYFETKFLKYEVTKQLLNDFSDFIVLEKFYDPEYNIFGSKLAKYELYSEILSNKIIGDKLYLPNFDSVLLPVRNLIFEIMGDEYSNFISEYVSYWNLGYSFESLNVKKQASDSTFDTLEILYTFWIKEKDFIFENYKQKKINESLLFKIIHMTLNKIGYSIIDELALMKSLIYK
ncbi:hypothetical protein ACS60E_03150 [Streptococcus suis]